MKTIDYIALKRPEAERSIQLYRLWVVCHGETVELVERYFETVTRECPTLVEARAEVLRRVEQLLTLGWQTT